MGKKSRKKIEKRQMLEQGEFWHYTTSNEFVSISKNGTLVTNTLTDDDKFGAVWLSSNPLIEKSVMRLVDLPDGKKSDPMELFEAFKYGIIPMRIKIKVGDLKITPWDKFCKRRIIPDDAILALNEISKRVGSKLSEWFAVFENITVLNWQSVDVWDGNMWISYKLELKG